MAATLFLWSTQLWDGRMDFLSTLCKHRKDNSQAFQENIIICVFYIHGLIPWSSTGRTGCIGWIPNWTRLVTLASKDMTDRHSPILAKSLNPTP